jgi:small subunit ribosomal protein S16
MVKIRLARGGRTNKADYTIVASDSRSPRDGQFLAKLGKYNPYAETVLSDVKVEEIKGWLAKGAQISTTVSTLLKKQGIKLA